MTVIQHSPVMRKPRTAFYRNPRARSAVVQVIFALLVLWIGYELVANARANLQAQRITTGLDFLDQPAGFDVSQSLIGFQPSDTYRRLFLVGLLNTLLVSVLGIVFATILGFAIGIARLSGNWLLARLAGGYVELIRNQPLLFQLLFWYLAVLGSLPPPREGVSLFDVVFLSNRGIFVPQPVFAPGSAVVLVSFAIGVTGAFAVRSWAKRRQAKTGQAFPVLWAALALVFGVPFLAAAATGFPLSLEPPRLSGFNYVGGIRVIPEFAALLIGLVIYTAAYIAETVRAGILAVSRGQAEAAYALGLRRGLALRLVIIPQALRVILPPLASHYLNLTKNSSLAVGIGYPDLMAVFAGTALNQTGQAIEIIAITMATYLVMSLITSALLNIYNSRTRLVER